MGKLQQTTTQICAGEDGVGHEEAGGVLLSGGAAGIGAELMGMNLSLFLSTSWWSRRLLSCGWQENSQEESLPSCQSLLCFP